MTKLVIEPESSLPAERILEAATDFTERRPELWPMLSRKPGPT